jgi:glycosyltransferase involved in cell wall biosynthesis
MLQKNVDNIKISIIFSNLGPYHLARLEGCVNYLNLSRNKVEIIAIELASCQEEYPWKIKRNDNKFSILSVIKNKSLEKTNVFDLISQLFAVLNGVKPDVIAIAGYFQPSMLSALSWCLWNHKPAILLSATTENDTFRSPQKELIKRLITTKYKAALVGGKPQKRYLIKLGMSDESIFLGYNVVGNNSFNSNNLRELPSLLDKPYFLAINRFVPKKNLSFLISSYQEYRRTSGNLAWDLVICGDGELRPQLEKQIADLGLSYCIHLPGFLQQDELLPYFAHAGCFIHASIQEQWGLVVNEAMAAGLPVLVSDRCGCFEDLVIEGVNGFGFDPENQEELVQLMSKVTSNEVDLEAMGKASLEHIQKFSPDYFAEGLMQAVEYALAQS